MYHAIGLVELSSIARGIEVSDVMLKGQPFSDQNHLSGQIHCHDWRRNRRSKTSGRKWPQSW